MKEVPGYQNWAVRSARAAGGYGLKMSHKYSVGVPDLLIALPGFVPCLVEVKYLGDDLLPGFSRKIDTTDKQVMELNRFQQANPNTAWVLVGGRFKSGPHKGTYLHQLYRPDEEQANGGHPFEHRTTTQNDLIPWAILLESRGVPWPCLRL